jgi:glycosyltransferase involved in cell wall biosynthesis
VTSPPLVSIVLPVHDGARFLEESLESVRAQTLSDWELVAVDDASTDATPEILARAAARDPRVRVVRSDAPLLLPGALNRGFAETRGSLLGWTSDDNAYRPRALAALADALARDPGADVAYADYTVVDAGGAPRETKRVPDARHLGYSNVIGPCFLFRRRVWEALGGYATDLFLAEDYDFWLRAVPRFRFLRVPEDLYAYRVHDAALGTSRRPEVLRATEGALRRNVETLPRFLRYEAWTRLEHLARDRGDAPAARAARRRAYAVAPLRTLRRRLRDGPPA